ncbi:Protein FAR1-RELATED SEQUENCE 5 [Linum grandiflorum]
MDFGVDGDVNGDLEGNIELDDSQVDEHSENGINVIDGEFRPDLCTKLDQESPGIEEALQDGFAESVTDTGDEPYIGQEFDSEAAAHAFYNSYATRVGFVIRVSKLSRSRRDGTAIGRALVCNKEGFRMPDKREKIVRQRAETRVGCRAMILVRKISSGKWTITKFVKEHTHPLTPGRGRRECLYDQYPNEHDRIRELSQQLAAEKKRAATYKRHLEMIFEQIEEQNQSLSNKIRHVVQSVRDIDNEDQQQN